MCARAHAPLDIVTSFPANWQLTELHFDLDNHEVQASYGYQLPEGLLILRLHLDGTLIRVGWRPPTVDLSNLLDTTETRNDLLCATSKLYLSDQSTGNATQPCNVVVQPQDQDLGLGPRVRDELKLYEQHPDLPQLLRNGSWSYRANPIAEEFAIRMISQRLGVKRQRVEAWRKRYLAHLQGRSADSAGQNNYSTQPRANWTATAPPPRAQQRDKSRRGAVPPPPAEVGTRTVHQFDCNIGPEALTELANQIWSLRPALRLAKNARISREFPPELAANARKLPWTLLEVAFEINRGEVVEFIAHLSFGSNDYYLKVSRNFELIAASIANTPLSTGQYTTRGQAFLDAEAAAEHQLALGPTSAAQTDAESRLDAFLLPSQRSRKPNDESAPGEHWDDRFYFTPSDEERAARTRQVRTYAFSDDLDPVYLDSNGNWKCASAKKRLKEHQVYYAALTLGLDGDFLANWTKDVLHICESKPSLRTGPKLVGRNTQGKPTHRHGTMNSSYIDFHDET
jgi:hypothetical protein